MELPQGRRPKQSGGWEVRHLSHFGALRVDRQCWRMMCGERGLPMRKFVTSLGFAAIFTALGRFLSAPLLLAERADATTGILFAAGLFTVAIAAVVRK
jgi:hypothetical protein